MLTKISKISFLLVLILLSLLFYSRLTKVENYESQKSTPVLEQKVENTAKISIDYGSGEKNEYDYQFSEIKTAYNSLIEILEENNIDYEVKQYDFGILIESIGGHKNSNEKAWIYFVNGKSANVGADQYKMENGDKIEWQYIKPLW